MIKSFLTGVLAALLAATPVGAATYEYRGQVISVIDGDTFKIKIDGWPAPFNPIDVRIDGIDTPEKKMPPAKSICETDLGKAASAYAHKIIRVGSTVTVTYDSSRHDKYGRLLGRVRLEDGTDYGDRMIAQKLARPYHGGTKSTWC